MHVRVLLIRLKNERVSFIMANDYNNDFGSGRLYKLTQNISWFFITTLWFNVHLIPLFFFFLFVEPTLLNVVWYLIGIIPLGPAIAALMSATIYVIEEDDFTDPTKQFWKYYKRNFMDALSIWLPYLVVVYLFSVNINYHLNVADWGGPFIGWLFIILTVLVTLYMMPLFLLTVKFEFRYIDRLKLGLYYYFMHMSLTFGNFFILFILSMALIWTTEWLLLAIPAVLSYFWILYNYRTIRDAKRNFTKEGKAQVEKEEKNKKNT
jgi:uncharacterized membrane protein YesL